MRKMVKRSAVDVGDDIPVVELSASADFLYHGDNLPRVLAVGIPAPVAAKDHAIRAGMRAGLLRVRPPALAAFVVWLGGVR